MNKWTCTGVTLALALGCLIGCGDDTEAGGPTVGLDASKSDSTSNLDGGIADGGQDVSGDSAEPQSSTGCDPCATSATCASAADPSAHCVATGTPSGADGSFCAADCQSNADCPQGSQCKDAVDDAGAAVKACLPDSGVCTCSASAIKAGLWTTCSKTSIDGAGGTIGTCKGQRVCSAEGLSLCDAASPTVETCNGVDDDCDGQTDEAGAAQCDDANPCTDDSCGGVGGCAHGKIEGACDDGSACTKDDTCADGKCGGAKVDCDDGNPCTDDACDAASGCTVTHNTAPCDDQSACSANDACALGLCVGATVVCDDDNACTDDACDAATGCTVTTDDTNDCSDDNACTQGDKCFEGSCAGAQVDCNDANGCTDDLCNAQTGCANTPNAVQCDDGSACTEGDICLKASCVGAPVQCDDANPCTDDACDMATGCTHTNNADPCTDSDGCTVGDVCASAKCVPGKLAVCDDNNTCSTDSCDKQTGECVFSTLADNEPCDDGTVCTLKDLCAGGQCTGKLIDCDDQKFCTLNVCHPVKGCEVINLDGKDCDDENACTLKDKCGGGACQPGAAKVCISEDQCVTGKCSVVTQKCAYANKPTGLACDDGTACTEKDGCDGGVCAGQVVNCDDGNPCTTDACDSKAGCGHVNSEQPCDDGTKCTVGDKCAGGKCSAGQKVVCDDENACTADTCDASSGQCKYADLTTSCDDGSKCTKEDTCKAGACLGAAVDCSDGKVCTDDTCDKAKGCVNTNNSAPCDDSDACTDFDKCADGACAGAAKDPVKDCDDGNPCTDDACDKINGCTSKANTKDCEDGNKCTQNDKCLGGKCNAGANTCGCQIQSDCLKQEDSDLCNGSLICEANKCVINPITVVICGTSDDTLCAKNECQPATGQCSLGAINEGKACDADGSVCTTNDKCASGQCTSGDLLACADDNPCTNDGCDSVTGCQHVANTAACDADSNACTVGDVCVDTNCTAGKAKVCDDNNSCTLDSCDKQTGSCTFDGKSRDGQNCDADGSVCTVSDTCAGGKCVAGKPQDCDDKNPCTNDSCKPAEGCQHAANTAGCDADGDACTVGDSCKDKLCIKGKATACDDNNPCTVDSCDKVSGQCVFDAKLQEGKACDADGSVCTDKDACASGKCLAGNALNCDDGNVCTTEKCDGIKGCAHVVNSVSCNADDNACTLNDACINTVCKAGAPKSCNDGNACTADACDKQSGKCSFTNLTTACDDGTKCTDNDTCANGACLGKSVNCDDDNPCTDDSCDQVKGCQNAANTAPCNDSDACTDFDQCASAQCLGKPKDVAKDCSDDNSCTDDGCDKASGCTHVANVGKCDDGNACTKNDTCQKGLCAPGPSICACQKDADCAGQEDGDLCNGTLSCVANKCVVNAATIITCDASSDTSCSQNQCTPKTGKCALVSVNEAKTCDADGSVCTVGDVCKAGKCLAGPAAKCGDSSVCTDDSCDKIKGCQNLANTADCDADGDACTPADKCKDKSCVAGAKKVCDDGKQCTLDSCNPKNGACVFDAVAQEGKGCDADGSVCTVSDVCKGGACIAGAKKNCDDGNGCTNDSCDKVSGCVNAANAAGCNADDNACTVSDVCKDKSCVAGPPKACDDKNACTLDSCYKQTGLCIFDSVPQEAKPCDADGSVCTQSDTCKAGKCLPGATMQCDDGNVCSDDSCDKVSGCVNAANTAGCNADDNPCTVSDVCKAKVCTAGPLKDCDDSKACTIDSCDKATGTCKNESVPLEGKPCDADGSVCTVGDKCKTGVCVPGGGLKCNDNNPCTDDSCDKLLGCQGAANTADCDADSDACTVGDKCKDKVCQAGPNKDCDDSNPCTLDACQSPSGKCANQSGPMNGKSCGNGGTCDKGKCNGG